MSRRFRVGLGAVGAVALLLRGLHVGLLLASPIGELLTQDAAHYYAEALRILGRLPSTTVPDVSFTNVGYPYFLALIQALGGSSIAAILAVQAVMDSITAVVVALAARLLLNDDRAAIAAGALYAIYAGALFYAGLVLTPCAINALLAVALLAVSKGSSLHLYIGCRTRCKGEDSTPSMLVAGASVGLAALLRPNMILIAPLMALAAWRGGTARGVRGCRAGPLVLLAAACAVPLPVIVHDAWAYSTLVPLSANGGMNFWVGNNRHAEGVYYAAEFLEEQGAAAEAGAFLDEARRRSGDPRLTLGASSAFWLREGLHEIRSDVPRWLRVEVRKVALFWNHFEAKTNVSMAFIGDFSQLLAHFTLGFGWLAVGGIAGLARWIAEDRRRALALTLPLIVVPLFTGVVFFVSGEYRHPASLALCIAAGSLVSRRIPGHRGGRWAVAAGVLALPLVYWPFPELRATCHPHLDYAVYARTICRGRPGGPEPGRAEFRRAESMLDRADTANGDDLMILETRLWLHAQAATRFKDRGEAEAALKVVAQLRSRDLIPGKQSPDYLLYLRRTIGARTRDLARLDIVRRDPALSAEAGLLGGNGYAEVDLAVARADFATALRFLEEALKRAPHDVELQSRMGHLLVTVGRPDEGRDWLTRACRGWPRLPECR